MGIYLRKKFGRLLLVCLLVCLSLVLFQNFSSSNSTEKEIALVNYISAPLNSFIGPSGSNDHSLHTQSLYISFPYIKASADVVKIDFDRDLLQAVSLERISLKLPELASWRTEQSWAHVISNGNVFLSSFGAPARLLKYNPTDRTLSSACETDQGLVKIWALSEGRDGEILMGASGENGRFYLYRYDPTSVQSKCKIVAERDGDLNEFDMIRSMKKIGDKVYLGLGSQKPGLAVFDLVGQSLARVNMPNCDLPGWIVFSKVSNSNGWVANSSDKNDFDCTLNLSENGFSSSLTISDMTDADRTYFVKYSLEPSLNIKLISKNQRAYPDIDVNMTPNDFYKGQEAFLFSLKALDDHTVLASSILPANLFKISVNASGESTVMNLGDVGSGEVYTYSLDRLKNIVYLGGYSTCSMLMAIPGSLNSPHKCNSETVQNIPCSPGASCSSNGSWRPRQMLEVDNKIYVASQEGYGVGQSFLTVVNKYNQQASVYKDANGWFTPNQWIYSLASFIVPQYNWKWVVGGTTQVPNQGSIRRSMPAKLFFWNTKVDQSGANLGNLNSLLTPKMIELNFGLSGFVTREIGALTQYQNRLVGVATLEAIELDSKNQVRYLSKYKNVLFMTSEIKVVRDLDNLNIRSWSLESVSNFPFAFNSAHISGEILTLVNQKHVFTINLENLNIDRSNKISRDRANIIYTAEGSKRIQAVDYSLNYLWFTVNGKVFRILNH